MSKPIEYLTVTQVRQRLRQQLPELSERYGVRTLWLFGSVVHGRQEPDSDLDILVQFDERPLSLLQFVALKNRLSDLLQVNVDLVEQETLKPAIGRQILAERVPV